MKYGPPSMFRRKVVKIGAIVTGHSDQNSKKIMQAIDCIFTCRYIPA
jgi:hypothetical protein